MCAPVPCAEQALDHQFSAGGQRPCLKTFLVVPSGMEGMLRTPGKLLVFYPAQVSLPLQRPIQPQMSIIPSVERLHYTHTLASFPAPSSGTEHMVVVGWAHTCVWEDGCRMGFRAGETTAPLLCLHMLKPPGCPCGVFCRMSPAPHQEAGNMFVTGEPGEGGGGPLVPSPSTSKVAAAGTSRICRSCPQCIPSSGHSAQLLPAARDSRGWVGTASRSVSEKKRQAV